MLFSFDVIGKASITVVATVFHAVKEQTDKDYLITASNKKIDIKKLNSGNLKWIAVSRDLMKKYGFVFGEKVFVESYSNPELNGEYQIEDLLHQDSRNHIDILVPEKYGANFKDDKCLLKFYGKCLD